MQLTQLLLVGEMQVQKWQQRLLRVELIGHCTKVLLHCKPVMAVVLFCAFMTALSRLHQQNARLL